MTIEIYGNSCDHNAGYDTAKSGMMGRQKKRAPE